MSLAVTEIRRSKLRYGLLTGAIALLAFLILFQQALLAGLVTTFIGAIRNQDSDVIVMSAESRSNLEASFVDPRELDTIANVEGVAEAQLLGESTFTVTSSGAPNAGDDGDGLQNAVIIGYTLDGPGAPRNLTSGRLATGDNEAVVDDGLASEGFDIGDVISIEPGNIEIEIVGLAKDIRYSVAPALFVSYDTYETASLSLNPDSQLVLPSAFVVDVADGADARDVATAIDNLAELEVDGLTLADAERLNPGVNSVNQSFNIILGMLYLVVPLVAGLFFLIITFQKAKSLTLLRALGAPNSAVVKWTLTQVFAVAGSGSAIAFGLVFLISRADGTLPFSLNIPSTLLSVGVIIALCLAASLVAIRRVTAVDVVDATTGNDVLS